MLTVEAIDSDVTSELMHMIIYHHYHYRYRYHSISGVGKNAPLGQSILTVEAIDSDVTSKVMQYDIIIVIIIIIIIIIIIVIIIEFQVLGRMHHLDKVY